MSWFLSYSGHDRDAACHLAKELQGAGLDVWCALLPGCLRPGESWVAGLERGLREASGYLILYGEKGDRGWVRAELDFALHRAAQQENFRIVPLLMPGIPSTELPPFLRSRQSLRLPAAPQDLAAALGKIPPEQPSFPVPEDGPFPGLDCFEEDRAPFYFGRERETLELAAKLGPTAEGYRRWLQIEGESGAGKSSLARAGLVPAVRRGWAGEWQEWRTRSWRVAVMRPGSRPLHNLAYELRKELEEFPIEEQVERWKSNPDELWNFLQGKLGPKENFLLLVDQFEELFTLAGDERAAFDRLLARALETPRTRFHLVTTLRSDFGDRFEESMALRRCLAQAERFPLQRMKDEALQKAITGPARVAGLRWEPENLPERLAADTLAAPGGLPLLAGALQNLWQECRGSKVLTGKVYDDAGGVAGALLGRADKLLGELRNSGLEENARRLLVALVHTKPGVEDARRSLGRAEAVDEAGGGHTGETVLQRLSGQPDPTAPEGDSLPVRLISIVESPGKPNVELAHEVLFRRWETLKNWIDEERPRQVLRERLKDQAQDYAAGRRGPPSARELRTYAGLEVKASMAGNFLRAGRQRRALLRGTAAGVCALLLGAAGWWFYDNQQRQLDFQIAADWETMQTFEEHTRERRWLADWKPLAYFQERRGAYEQRWNKYQKVELPVPDQWKLDNPERLLAGLKQIEAHKAKLRPFPDPSGVFGGQQGWAERWEVVERDSSIQRREDLYPLGKNSAGLWEFAHPKSGWQPSWDEEDEERREWKLEEDSGIVFVLLLGDSFPMGSPEGEADQNADERRHEVTTDAFFLAKYETTERQYQIFSSDDPADIPLNPRSDVTWHEAQRYCEWAGGTLPTEAQWEYACRAGTRSAYFWGEDPKRADEYAWHDGNSDFQVHPVGQKLPNPWGLHDVAGNAWEWCLDWYGPYPSGLVENPAGPPAGTHRVLRGGSYGSDARWLRSALRDWLGPWDRVDVLGFRVCLPAAPVVVEY